MKAIKLLLAILVVFCSLATPTAHTQEAPPVPSSENLETLDSLPISSIPELRAWALEQIRNIYSSAWSPTSVPGSNTLTQVSGHVDGVDVIEDIKWLNSLKFRLDVHNQDEGIQFYISFENNDGWSLFYANGSSLRYYISATGELNTLPVGLELRMNNFIPIPVSGVESAYIIERDNLGNIVNQRSVSIFSSGNGISGNRSIYFPAYFAGKNGELIVGFSDSTRRVYSLQNGRSLPKQRVKSSLNASIAGVIGLKDTNVVYVAVSQKDYDEGRNTTVQLTLSEDTEVYLASWLPNTDIEKAYAVRIRPVGMSEIRTFSISAPNYYVPVQLRAGKYWVTFKFGSRFGEHEYTPPVMVNEKGG